MTRAIFFHSFSLELWPCYSTTILLHYYYWDPPLICGTWRMEFDCSYPHLRLLPWGRSNWDSQEEEVHLGLKTPTSTLCRYLKLFGRILKSCGLSKEILKNWTRAFLEKFNGSCEGFVRYSKLFLLGSLNYGPFNRLIHTVLEPVCRFNMTVLSTITLRSPDFRMHI